MHKVDSIIALATKVELLSKRIDSVLISNSQSSPLPMSHNYDICVGPYPTHECRGKGTSNGQKKQVSYVGNVRI